MVRILYKVITMKIYFVALLLLSITTYAQPSGKAYERDKKVGSPCECCEAIYEQAPDLNFLNETDTLPDFEEAGPKMLVYGTIYKKDGTTPAAGIVLYIYHTDQTGRYTSTADQTGCAKRHGRLRGWVKTNSKGEYRFYSLTPAAYPNAKIPAHIHPVIKEPGLSEYYIDEYLFDGDPFLTTEEKNGAENRGGNGIIKLSKDADGMLLCKRDIVLGKNIPGY
jgi:protocatechuate 3,4-dioxygenase, beta subunit